ncbi:MAG: hypothetical protein IBJ07_17765 [Rhizobiaceae bacterium]|nr:hypothetical protein [Rhizobiaceae bacterium]
METIRQIAVFCVGRAVMFGALAIGLVMLSFSFDPAWAFRAGAIMTLVMAAILVFKAQTAKSKLPSRTEVWIYLDDGMKPKNDHAVRYFGKVLSEVYGRFAQVSLMVACAMFVVSQTFFAMGFTFLEIAAVR